MKDFLADLIDYFSQAVVLINRGFGFPMLPHCTVACSSYLVIVGVVNNSSAVLGKKWKVDYIYSHAVLIIIVRFPCEVVEQVTLLYKMTRF
jgi:hypothetical protein